MAYPDKDDLIEYVYAEARLLDEARYQEWLSLFAEAGIYWMPLEPGQTDSKLVTSLLYEDLFLLKVRIERLSGLRTYSQKPKSRCHHLLQRPFVDEFDASAGCFVVSTPFHYVETRGDEQNLYAAWSRHELALMDGDLKIRLKRVDLVNADAAFGNIQLLL